MPLEEVRYGDSPGSSEHGPEGVVLENLAAPDDTLEISAPDGDGVCERRNEECVVDEKAYIERGGTQPESAKGGRNSSAFGGEFFYVCIPAQVMLEGDAEALNGSGESDHFCTERDSGGVGGQRPASK